MWKHYANYEAVTFKYFSNMVLVSNKILHGLQHKNIKEVIFYLHKFKSYYMVYIITLNNGKKPILINNKTEVRALDDPSLLSALAHQSIDLVVVPSVEEILVLTVFALGTLKTLFNESHPKA